MNLLILTAFRVFRALIKQFKFQYESINPHICYVNSPLVPSFKFQYESINPITRNSLCCPLHGFKFQYESINPKQE